MNANDLIQKLKNNPALAARNKDLKIEPEKHNKYNARPDYYDGIYFDSQAELKRYCELKLLKRAGEIKSFKVHPKYPLTHKRCYEADFEIEYADGHIEVEDVKGFMTARSSLAIDLFKEQYPDIKFVLVEV